MSEAITYKAKNEALTITDDSIVASLVEVRTALRFYNEKLPQSPLTPSLGRFVDHTRSLVATYVYDEESHIQSFLESMVSEYPDEGKWKGLLRNLSFIDNAPLLDLDEYLHGTYLQHQIESIDDALPRIPPLQIPHFTYPLNTAEGWLRHSINQVEIYQAASDRDFRALLDIYPEANVDELEAQVFANSDMLFPGDSLNILKGILAERQFYQYTAKKGEFFATSHIRNRYLGQVSRLAALLNPEPTLQTTN